MAKTRGLVVLAFVAVTGLGCDAEAASETRDLAEFRKIETDGAFDLNVSIGAAQSVVLEGDAEDIASVRTRVGRGRLRIEFDGDNQDNEITVRITLAKITALTLRGSNDAALDGVDSENFELVIGGSGNVAITGTCGDMVVKTGGSAAVDARHFECRDVDLTIGGSAEVELYATENLSVSIAGHGDVGVHGNPQGKMRLAVDGSGKIEMN